MSIHFPLRSSAALICVALFIALSAHGQRGMGISDHGRGISDDQVVRESMFVASDNRVALYQHRMVVDPALLHVAEEDLPRIEQLLGLKFDEATFGHKIRIYVSPAISVSHVWRAYDLPKDPRAIILLNPMVARLAVTGANATLTHEMTHLLTWRYRSHTLREGIADYVALTLHPGAGVGPNVQGYGAPPTVRPEVEKYLGTTIPPPEAAETDREFRKEYYFASYRFVKFLIERKGIPVFLQLYNSKDPQAEFPSLYGASRAELVLAARDEH